MTKKGKKIMAAMHKQYGHEKGEHVFYASKNAGTITHVEQARGHKNADIHGKKK
jgi:hypothetical protein